MKKSINQENNNQISFLKLEVGSKGIINNDSQNIASDYILITKLLEDDSKTNNASKYNHNFIKAKYLLVEEGVSLRNLKKNYLISDSTIILSVPKSKVEEFKSMNGTEVSELIENFNKNSIVMKTINKVYNVCFFAYCLSLTYLSGKFLGNDVNKLNELERMQNPEYKSEYEALQNYVVDIKKLSTLTGHIVVKTKDYATEKARSFANTVKEKISRTIRNR